MIEESLPPPIHKMRNLRAGRKADLGAPGRDPQVYTSLAAFSDALSSAIEQARQTDLTVLVLRIRPRTVNLTRWSRGPDIRVDGLDDIVMARMRAVDEDIALYHCGRRDYLCFVPGTSNKADAERLAGRIATVLSGPIEEGNGVLVIAPQVGAAVVDAENFDAELSIDAATLTVGQTTPEAPFLIYGSYVRAARQREAETEQDLALAIVNHELGANFQARLSCHTGEVAGLEVFVRWAHHRRGTVPVPELLRVAERIGILFELGGLVRDLTYLAAARWREEGLYSDQRIWFNVSAVELFHPQFLSSLENDGMDGFKIGFDIADSDVLNEKLAVDKIAEIRSRGIAVALDRVTSPAESLRRLKRLPLSAVNLSGELVRQYTADQTYRDLVSAVVQIAHERGSEVTATQIESQQQLEVSRSIGIDQIQGRFIHAPCPQTRMGDLLRSLAIGPEERRAKETDLD